MTTISNKLEFDLISKIIYRKEISNFLTKYDLAPNKLGLLRYFALYLMYVLTISLFAITNALYFKLLYSFLLCVLLTCLTFFLHDLMHGSVIKSKFFISFLGNSIGVLNLFPPLFWQRVHNFHHARCGSLEDPDRNYILSEKPKKAYEIALYKLRVSNESFNNAYSLFLISFGFISYFISNIYYGLFANSNDTKTSIKYKGLGRLFTKKDKVVVFSELLLIFLFQYIIFYFFAGGSIINYFLVSILPILFSHFVAQLYVHTNHIMSPLTLNVDDTLVNSVSIKNNKLIDFLFSNFSHHAEHHLFPTTSSIAYPKIRKIIQNLYPERFNLVRFKSAISYLFNTPRIYADDFYLTNLSTDKTYPCLAKINLDLQLNC